jgi:hypothetical protein
MTAWHIQHPSPNPVSATRTQNIPIEQSYPFQEIASPLSNSRQLIFAQLIRLITTQQI